MADFYKGTIPILDDSTNNDVFFPTEMGRGYVPRDFATDPVEMFAAPGEMDLVNPNDYDGLYDAQEANQSSLQHLRLRANEGGKIWSLNQGQFGYCWGHSMTHATMLARARKFLPYVPLSAFAVCAIIKKGKDEGGWCGLSAKFIRESGVPSQKYWPQGSVNLAQDTPDMRNNAALHKITEDWADLARPVYDQNMTQAQVFSACFRNEPGAVDFNWWAHSVAYLRCVRIEKGSYGLLIWNSWYLEANKEWGDQGMAVLRGSKAIPNGAIAIRSVTPAAAV